MDQKTIEEEKAKLMMKFFDYAETPIQEWIAEYLNVDVAKLFSDYQDNSDVIGFKNENNNCHYEAYLVTMEPNAGRFVDKQLLDSSEKTRKACSMLFDAVHQVFPAVMSTINKDYAEHVKSLCPKFSDTNMSFSLYMINSAATELQVSFDTRKKLIQCLENGQLEEKRALDVMKKLAEINDIINKNTKEVLDSQEKICKVVNESLTTKNCLYLVVNTSSVATEDSLQRLPAFGLKYQDPDEDTYIDKIKKEYKIT